MALDVFGPPPPPLSELTVKERKKELARRRKQDRRHERRHRNRSCFWIWPWGHVFSDTAHDGMYFKCAACGVASRLAASAMRVP